MELAAQYLEVISSLSISEKFKKSAEGLLAKKKKHDGVKAIEHKIREFNHCVSIMKKDLKQKELEIVQLSESLRNQGIIK